MNRRLACSRVTAVLSTANIAFDLIIIRNRVHFAIRCCELISCLLYLDAFVVVLVARHSRKGKRSWATDFELAVFWDCRSNIHTCVWGGQLSFHKDCIFCRIFLHTTLDGCGWACRSVRNQDDTRYSLSEDSNAHGEYLRHG